MLRDQSGVVSLVQLKACGWNDADVARLVRRRLTRVHPRVFVDHSGPLTRAQREWAAVLWAAPAALSHQTAVTLGTKRSSAGDLIHIAIDHSRRLPDREGVRVHRRRGFDTDVLHLRPPRIRLEEALIDLAGEATGELALIGVLADVCGERRTTGTRLLAAARRREFLPHRELILAVLSDIATGSCSALEQAYLDRVVRPHGLPEGTRQASHRHAESRRYCDVALDAQRLYVELDGRLFHESTAARDADLDRDLDSAVELFLTVRLGWGQAVARPCATAAKLAAVMITRGWEGRPGRCAACADAA